MKNVRTNNASYEGVEMKNMKKKLFCKKLSAFAIAVLMLTTTACSNSKVNENMHEQESTSNEMIEDFVESSSKFDNIGFYPMKIKNDSTGNWRVSTIAESIDIQDYALDYYKKYFENDNQIHAIVNFNYNITAKISVVGNLLDVTIHEYVAKEEHDARLLFSGTVLKEYHVNMETGKVEEI